MKSSMTVAELEAELDKVTAGFYAVRVVIEDDAGSTYTRDYVRGERHMGRERFAAWALGDLLTLIDVPAYRWTIEEVTPGQVYEGMRQS